MARVDDTRPNGTIADDRRVLDAWLGGQSIAKRPVQLLSGLGLESGEARIGLD